MNYFHYDVFYVMNITDVDDKVGLPWLQLIYDNCFVTTRSLQEPVEITCCHGTRASSMKAD